MTHSLTDLKAPSQLIKLSSYYSLKEPELRQQKRRKKKEKKMQITRAIVGKEMQKERTTATSNL